ncbi:MAG: cell wall-binding repeat-containing protein [Actinobacteria bacterium]|nr:cell wall-binding repeat-containing protein [Actinomycetota bacterium]
MRIRFIGAATAAMLVAGVPLTLQGAGPGTETLAAVPAAETTASAVAVESATTPAGDEPTAAAVTPDPVEVPGQPPACVTTASQKHDIVRLSGDDRFATAACASQLTYPEGAATVLLARGDEAGGYADALAGTVLAHAESAPVLMTRPDELPSATRTELERLDPERVLVLGGTKAVSNAVVRQVEGLGVTAERVAGDDRAGTAAAIADRVGASGTAFVVNGFRPPDALVAGAVAARAGAALLLVDDDRVPPSTAAALEGVGEVVIIGGYGVVSESAEAALVGLVPKVRRVSGASRDETAASVARTFPADATLHVVAGADRSLVDAIAAGWLAALPGGGPVLYAERDAPGHGSDRYLRLGGLADRPPARLLGGTSVLSDDLVATLEQRYDEATAGGPQPELRAFWVHLFDSALKSPAGIDRVLDAATRANLNTVVVQVVRRHDAYYASDVLPRTSDPAMPRDLDLLGRLIPAAKARGLDVHAWFVLAPAYHGAYDEVGLPPGHVYRDHGPASSDPWTTVSHDGRTSDYLDLGVPAVQDHVVAMITEVASRYDVAAIHLDYLRYDGTAWGYHPAVLARFRDATGRSDRPATTDGQWSDFRRGLMSELAQRIHDAVDAIDPDIRISMAAIAQGRGPTELGGFARTRAYAEKFQDWPMWLQRGWIDDVMPMIYFRENHSDHRAWHRDWIGFADGLVDGPGEVAYGHAAYLNNVAESMAQLEAGLAATSGAVLFSYQQDTCQPASDVVCSSVDPIGSLLGHLRAGRFAAPAPAP